MRIRLPENVKKVLDVLEAAGFEAYLVGGGVRDAICGNVSDDFDVCTNAFPDDILRLFEKTVPTGIKHGTVTVISGDTKIEVTTFRTDGEYDDFRHPDKVSFTGDLTTDLSRRDFTVNAICYSERTGIIDLFDGISDLKSKVLRTVGDPEKRFGEDALRILRLYRFASTLGFDIEPKTGLAALKNAALLKNISAERIRNEFIKLSGGAHPEAVLPLLNTGAIDFLSPDERVSEIPLLGDNSRLRFFAFLYLTGRDPVYAAERLKYSNAFKSYSKKMITAEDMPHNSRVDVKRLLTLLEEDIFDFFDFRSAILGEDTNAARETAREIIAAKEPYKISALAVSGDDVIAKGYKGAAVGNKLGFLLDRVIEDPELNSKDKLLHLL